jgi:hypothetical protein
MGIYDLGQTARELPGALGRGIRRAPQNIAEAAQALAESQLRPARMAVGGIEEALQEVGAGFHGMPSQNEMRGQIPAFRAPTNVAEAASAVTAQAQRPEPPGPVRSIRDVVDGPDGPPVRQMGTGPTPALEAGQFRGSDMPDWGMDLSQAQMEQDERAHGMLDRRHQQRVTSIEDAAKALGDPMERQLEARQKTLAYESLMPEGAMGRIRASYGGDGPLAGSEIGSEAVGDYPTGIPTIGQVLEQQNRVKPEDERKFRLDKATGEELEALTGLSQRLQAEVRRGRPIADADAEFKRAQDQAAFRLQALQGSTLAAWGPQKEDPYAAAAAPLPPQK